MYEYLFEPRAPLVFRRGRPFGATDVAATAPFPRPDTVAGALRAAWVDTHEPSQRSPRVAQARERAVQGPLLVRSTREGAVRPALFPQPADAEYLREDGGGAYVAALEPRRDGGQSASDLPDGLAPAVRPQEFRRLGWQPAPGAAFWSLEHMTRWLIDAPAVAATPRIHATLGRDGRGELPLDRRAHVQLDPERGTGAHGVLFRTEGVGFGSPRPPPTRDGMDPSVGYGEALALLARADGSIGPALRRVGGRGRVARLAHAPGAWPRCPAPLARALREAARTHATPGQPAAGRPGLRLVLATPGLFRRADRHGWLPDWLHWCAGDKAWRGELSVPPALTDDAQCDEGAVDRKVGLRLVAACAGRGEPVTGWDLEAREPKPLAHLVPAGSVYWFEVVAGERWLPDLWMCSLCSPGTQEHRDGFGLALPGLWAAAAPAGGRT